MINKTIYLLYYNQIFERNSSSYILALGKLFRDDPSYSASLSFIAKTTKEISMYDAGEIDTDSFLKQIIQKMPAAFVESYCYKFGVSSLKKKIKIALNSRLDIRKSTIDKLCKIASLLDNRKDCTFIVVSRTNELAHKHIIKQLKNIVLHVNDNSISISNTLNIHLHYSFSTLPEFKEEYDQFEKNVIIRENLAEFLEMSSSNKIVSFLDKNMFLQDICAKHTDQLAQPTRVKNLEVLDYIISDLNYKNRYFIGKRRLSL